MDLEWAEVKRQDALVTRLLDFADVARIEPGSVATKPDLRHDYGEPRFSSFGLLDGVLVNFIWTPRGTHIRIISMRKANDRERKSYQAI